MAEIVLFGATGHTGRLVAAELRRAGLRPLLAGRNRVALERLAAEWSPDAPVAVAAPDDPASLRAMLSGSRVLINTVGPFSDFGPPVVAAALDAGAHYLDSTGEQHFMARCRADFHARALRQGLAVLNAAAFEYALGTLAAARLLELHGPIRQIDVSYLFGDTRTSPGTRKSMLRIATLPGLGFEQGRFIPRRPLSLVRSVTARSGRRVLTGWFPAGEILFLPRLGVQTVRTFLSTSALTLRLGRALMPVLPLLALPTARRVLERLLDLGGAGPTDERRGRPTEIIVEGDDPFVRTSVSLYNPYGITATILVEGARRLLAEPPRVPGVISPAEAFEVGEFLEVLRQHGVQVEPGQRSHSPSK